MKEDHQPAQNHCLNCNAALAGTYCHSCGQPARENTDRSIIQLLGDFLGNVFFIDNRFLLSVGYLIRYPGRMTVEFLEGKRKKFISPVTLFLFVNLIYFFVSPLTDYSLSLYDQFYDQPYSEWIQDWVKSSMRASELESEAYNTAYQTTSNNISKLIMIINIPMIAFFIYLMAFKKRRFYYDNLIYSFHFFSVYISSWIMLGGTYTLLNLFVKNEESMIYSFSFYLFVFVIPVLYASLSIKKFMDIPWYWAIPAAGLASISVTLTNLIYRFVILVLTLWMT